MSNNLPKTPSFSLDGKRALITGAGTGIGKAAAAALAEVGAEVYLVGRREEVLNEVAKQIQDTGKKASVLALDITDVKVTTAAIEQHGPFDILVNNAGTTRPKPSIETSEEDFDAVMDLNVKAAFFVATAYARELIKANRSGSLINISSQMGQVSGHARALYSASKFAMEGFTRGMAIEWGKHNIRVNTLAPTFLKTPLTESLLADKDFIDEVLSKIVIGRLGTVEDLMGAIIFLASDASALITGSTITADGGWTAA